MGFKILNPEDLIEARVFWNPIPVKTSNGFGLELIGHCYRGQNGWCSDCPFFRGVHNPTDTLSFKKGYVYEGFCK